MNFNLTDFRQRWDKAKLTKAAAFWIAIGAIILTMLFGFTRGGWVTGGTAIKMAERSSQGAVVERLTPICVAQFNLDAERTLRLEEFTALTSTSQRSKFVSEHGWATMPGEEKADGKVAAACAQQIVLINDQTP